MSSQKNTHRLLSWLLAIATHHSQPKFSFFGLKGNFRAPSATFIFVTYYVYLAQWIERPEVVGSILARHSVCFLCPTLVTLYEHHTILKTINGTSTTYVNKSMCMFVLVVFWIVSSASV